MKKIHLNILWDFRNVILLLVMSCAITCNLIKTYEEFRSFNRKRALQPYVFIGSQFEGLRGILKNTPKIGYYTDKSLDDRITAAKFAQAQYILTPTILDLNSINLPFVIVDYEDPRAGMKKIYELGMIPLQQSSTGIILAKNPKIQQP